MSSDSSNNLDDLLGQEVVLDTAGPIFYLGRLVSYDANGFWLAEADMHNTTEGHASREQYIAEAHLDGIRVNRSRAYVFRQAVISVSALRDIVSD